MSEDSVLTAEERETLRRTVYERASLDDLYPAVERIVAARTADLRKLITTLHSAESQTCTCTPRENEVTDSRGCKRHYLLSLLDEIGALRRQLAAVTELLALSDRGGAVMVPVESLRRALETDNTKGGVR